MLTHLVLHCSLSNLVQEATESRVYFSLDEPAAIERLLMFQYISWYCDTDILPSPISGAFIQPLICRYGPPFGSSTFSGGSGGLFPTSTLGPYDPVDKTDPVNKALQWTTQAVMQTPILTFRGSDVARAPDPTLEKATKDQITSVFQLNVQMYALAQRFDLEDLKTQSLTKIKCKEHYLRYCFLDRVLDTVYELSSPDDADLRSWLFQRCVANYKIVELMPRAVQKLSEHDVKVAGPDRYCAWTFEVANKTFEEAKQSSEMWNQCYKAQIQAKEVELAKARADFADSDTRRDEEVADLKTKLKEAKQKIGPQMGANGRKNREIEALQQQNHALQQEVEASQRQVQFLRQVSGYRGPL